MRLIDADALLDDVMERYCKDCNNRKGNLYFVYQFYMYHERNQAHQH